MTGDAWAGLIYKVQLISGREKRGGHGVIISPQKRLDFRDRHKDKIRWDMAE